MLLSIQVLANAITNFRICQCTINGIPISTVCYMLINFGLDTVKRLQNEGKLGELKNIVVIVCGGLAVNLEYLEQWKKQVGIA